MLTAQSQETAATEEFVEEELEQTDLEDAVDNVERVIPAI